MADLKAKQVSALVLPDGGIGLVIVDTKGAIYTMHETGWQPVRMTLAVKQEEKHDS